MSAESPPYGQVKEETDQLGSELNHLLASLDEKRSQFKRKVEVLEAARKEALQELLDKEGLACCSERDHRHGIVDAPHEGVGVFPKSQLTFWYSSRTWHSRGDHYGSPSSGRTVKIEVLCPFHLEQRNPAVSHSDVSPGIDIESRIRERGGRFFTEINEVDVTEQIKPVEPDEKVYRHFGFASVPSTTSL